MAYRLATSVSKPAIRLPASSALKNILLSVLCCAVIAGVVTPAPASTVGGWWGGNWKCNIDGRPARMKWVAVDDTQTSCDGDTCTSSYGARWKGSFSDNGSRWVSLTHPREGGRGGLYFRHADGNQWYLPKPTSNKTIGWTTWNGQRYHLSCWR